MTDLAEEIQKDVARRIRDGFGGFEENVRRTVDYLQDSYPGTDIEPLVRAAAAPAWAKAREEQALWPVPTDCDRLDRAFAALERQGVVARQNFACCCNCANAEIGMEIDEARKSMDVIGFTYYHMQSMERAAERGELSLGYGALEEGEAAQKEVGRMVAEALSLEGLTAEWDGDPGRCVLVTGMDWRRRLRFV